MTTAAADEEETEPPASVLTRRRALVPPKIPPYNMDSSEDTEQSADKETSTRLATSFRKITIISSLILLFFSLRNRLRETKIDYVTRIIMLEARLRFLIPPR